MLLRRQVDEFNLEVSTFKGSHEDILQFWVNSVLNCLNPNTYKKSPLEFMKKISNKFYQGASLTTITFLVIFAGIALKVEQIGPIVSSINSYPCLPIRP